MTKIVYLVPLTTLYSTTVSNYHVCISFFMTVAKTLVCGCYPSTGISQDGTAARFRMIVSLLVSNLQVVRDIGELKVEYEEFCQVVDLDAWHSC